MNPRLLASRMLQQVIFQGKSLNSCVPQFTQHIDNPKDRAMARELVSGALRFFERLSCIQTELMKKPLKAKDSDVQCLLFIGLYQIFYMRVPDHAAVSETVKLTQKLKKPWARGLVNGVLRQSIRDRESLLEKIEACEEARFSHPAWLIEKIKTDWPDDYQTIFDQNLHHAPMTLRVNQQKQTRDEYLNLLSQRQMQAEALEFSKDAIGLATSTDVQQLPGFTDGCVSVQDQAAQLAAGLLQLENGLNVLDACAAPGGKTAHMLETQPDLNVLALDVSAERLKRVEETLNRLQLKAKTCAANAVEVDSWWDGEYFDRILLDAPCSAIGVIRRNPDIKIHRKKEDIPQLVKNQRKLLDALWKTLKPGGVLLYATCSILKDENENQIAAFIASNDDAQTIEIDGNWGRDVSMGKQILPGDHGMDGFYYARIRKMESQ